MSDCAPAHHCVWDEGRHDTHGDHEIRDDRHGARGFGYPILQSPPANGLDQLVCGEYERHGSEGEIASIIDVAQCVDSGGTHDQSGDEICFR